MIDTTNRRTHVGIYFSELEKGNERVPTYLVEMVRTRRNRREQARAGEAGFTQGMCLVRAFCSRVYANGGPLTLNHSTPPLCMCMARLHSRLRDGAKRRMAA
jgi:hypothetical protein